MFIERFRHLKFWTASILLVGIFIAIANSLDAGSSTGTPRFEQLSEKMEQNCLINGKTQCVNAYIRMVDFDPEGMLMKGRIWVYPPSEYAESFGSSVRVLYKTDVFLDAATVDVGEINTELHYDRFDFLRSIEFTLDVTNFDDPSRASDQIYPFDKYSANITGTVDFITDEGATASPEDDVRETLPINVIEYSAVIPNWTMKYDFESRDAANGSVSDGVNYQMDGSFYTVVRIERSEVTVLIVALLGLIFLGGAISMLFLIRSIMLSKRKASLSGLVWAGSTVFTLIQTRTLMPGDPRLGVKFDLFIFYPAIAIAFISTIILLRQWLLASEIIEED
jgi:hypothetical protein